MMGSENNTGFEHNVHEDAQVCSLVDALETITLDQSPQTYLANRDYKSLMSGGVSLSETQTLKDVSLSETQTLKDPLRSLDRSLSHESSSDDESPLPPSYSDVVFSPDVGDSVENGISHGQGNGSSPGSGNGHFSTSNSRSSDAAFLTVTVSQPQKEQDNTASLVPGGNTYVTYLIHTRTNIPEFGGKEFQVRRRFRDVVALSDRLAESYRGFIIPPRPDKNIVESQVMHKEEFVEQRRIALEKYLHQLAGHPVIRKSKELLLFLRIQGKMPLPTTTDMASRVLDGAAKLPKQLFSGEGNVISPEDVAQPAKGGRDLLRMFKELKQYVTNDWRGTRPPVVEEDKQFLEKKEKLRDLEHHLSQASQQAESLVKAQQELGEAMGELGLAFFKIYKSESSEATSNYQRVHAADVKRIGTAAVKHSRISRETNAQAVKSLDQLHEYLGLMQAIHTAFADRSNALLTVQMLVSELSTMNTRVENLQAASSRVFGGDRNRTRKAEELRNAIKVTEEARDRANEEYEHIKENNRIELERFETERRHDFLEMLKGFVHSQIGYAEKAANVWTKVAEESSEYVGRSAVSPLFGFRGAN